MMYWWKYGTQASSLCWSDSNSYVMCTIPCAVAWALMSFRAARPGKTETSCLWSIRAKVNHVVSSNLSVYELSCLDVPTSQRHLETKR